MGGRGYAFRHVPSWTAQCALNLMLSLHMITRSTIRWPAGNKVAHPNGAGPRSSALLRDCRTRTWIDRAYLTSGSDPSPAKGSTGASRRVASRTCVHLELSYQGVQDYIGGAGAIRLWQ